MLLAAHDRHTIAHRLHRFHETVLAADLPLEEPPSGDVLWTRAEAVLERHLHVG